MKNKRKLRYKNGQLQEFMFKGEKNSCNCGSNIFHDELDGDTVIGVCNACDKDIYEFNYTKEEIKEMEWVENKNNKRG